MRYPHDHENEVNYFARTNFRNQMTKFGIKTDDRRRHMYIIGKTGMGKTTLMENMILSDIYAGHGCCYVDPHGDTAERLVDFIPSWRLNDVVYFNPADSEYPIGFNILESVNPEHKHLVAEGLMGVFKKLWENVWSARMEYILSNCILALLDNPGSTLLGVNRMLTDGEYRKRIVSNIQDPIVKSFWVKEFANYTDRYVAEAVPAIQNKVGQFLSASIIRNIVAQVKSTIDIRDIMDNEKIMIVNLSKGRIGEDTSRLLGGMVITKIQLAAMERVDIPEEDRRDFFLYVDEFQNFAVESFASILSEARKYRLCLTMAHQYIAQLSDEVREAVFGNVGSLVTYRVGAPDAEFMEKEFTPRFLVDDIINLPKYNVYLKLLIDGVTSQPFSAITLPPIAKRTFSTDKVNRISRERYTTPRADIEKKILKWSGMGEDADIDTMLDDAEVKKKEDKKQRGKPRHEYNCTRCNTDIVLPVELDRSRPIYCEDCIKIVRDERKKGKDNKKKRTVKKAQETRDVKDGEFVKIIPEEPSISLSALAPTRQKEKREETKVESRPIQPDDTARFSGESEKEEKKESEVGARLPKPVIEKPKEVKKVSRVEGREPKKEAKEEKKEARVEIREPKKEAEKGETKQRVEKPNEAKEKVESQEPVKVTEEFPMPAMRFMAPSVIQVAKEAKVVEDLPSQSDEVVRSGGVSKVEQETVKTEKPNPKKRRRKRNRKSSSDGTGQQNVTPNSDRKSDDGSNGKLRPGQSIKFD